MMLRFSGESKLYKPTFGHHVRADEAVVKCGGQND